MPEKPRWRDGINAAFYDEDYSTLWRRRGHFFDGAIHRFRNDASDNPQSTKRTLDLARVHLKDEQVRLGSSYRDPGAQAEADAAARRRSDLEAAVELLREAIKWDSQSGTAHFYLGLALERQGKVTEAVPHYRKALSCRNPAAAAGLYLARLTSADNPAEAAALARRAANLYPQSTRARHMLMIALSANGKAAEAVSTGRELIEMDPANVLTLRLLEDALRSNGETEEALICNREAKRLCANNSQMQQAVERDLKWLRGESPGAE
jgi:tetratricopeptide (TPR) repeat protein